jgi:transposase InsO family protein
MLMQRAGVASRNGARKRSFPGAPTAEDLVDRVFVRDRPNQLWLTDITEHPTREGKVYCTVVLDAFSRRVVGWSISHNPTAALTSNALGMAIEQRAAHRGKTVIHSDHGTQFTFWAFTERARQSGLGPSMGSVGDCYDNAMIEASGRGCRVELLDTRRWRTRVDLANAIFEYIEIFHNRRRRHSSCEHRSNMNYSTPQQRSPESRKATPPKPGHCEASVKTGMAHGAVVRLGGQAQIRFLCAIAELSGTLRSRHVPGDERGRAAVLAKSL